MADYTGASHFDSQAELYDQLHSAVDENMITRLVELARGGKALELGIGTGRVALPLRDAGVPVEGIDASEQMVERLRAKPGGATVQVSMGDFAEVKVEGEFDLIFVVFNSFFDLRSQEDQIRCFQNVASHLTSEGVFVIEAFVPDMTRYVRRQNVEAVNVDSDRVVLEVARLDLLNQTVTAQLFIVTEAGTKFFPIRLRYAWPSELDLMARLAGLQLRERWADWSKKEFRGEPSSHISVYERGGFERTVISPSPSSRR